MSIGSIDPIDLARRLESFVESPIRRIADLLESAHGDPSIISFGGGEPSLDPPLELLDWLHDELALDPHRVSTYTSTAGLLQLRSELAYELGRSGVKIDASDIVITIGATEALYLAIHAVVNPGDEVILFDPTYVSYEPTVTLAGGKVRWVATSARENFEPDIEDVKAAITPRTKAIILLSPDNPTGRVLSESFVKAIADLAQDKKFFIISDEAYKEMLFEGRHVSPAEFSDKAIVCSSFSKVASIPGFRSGYLYTKNSDVIKGVMKLKQFVSLCSVLPAQVMLTRFYQHGLHQKYLREVVIPTYRKRRDVMTKALRELLPDAYFSPPQGAFYVFPDFSSYTKHLGLNDESFADELFKRSKVVVVPGHYFGASGKNHVRLTFVTEPEERIVEGLERIAKFVSLANLAKPA